MWVVICSRHFSPPCGLGLRRCRLGSQPPHSVLLKATRSLFRQHPPLLSPMAVLPAHRPSPPPPHTVSNCRGVPHGKECKCGKCRVCGVGQAGRKRSRPASQILGWTLAQASLIGGYEKRRTTTRSLTHRSPCAPRDRALGWRLAQRLGLAGRQPHRGVQPMKSKVFADHVLVLSWPLVFVCLWCGGSTRVGVNTPITLRLNVWALLKHLPSPSWSRQHTNRGSSACLQEGFCSVSVQSHGFSAADCSECTCGGNRPHRRRAAAGRRCCSIFSWVSSGEPLRPFQAVEHRVRHGRCGQTVVEREPAQARHPLPHSYQLQRRNCTTCLGAQRRPNCHGERDSGSLTRLSQANPKVPGTPLAKQHFATSSTPRQVTPRSVSEWLDLHACKVCKGLGHSLQICSSLTLVRRLPPLPSGRGRSAQAEGSG